MHAKLRQLFSISDLQVMQVISKTRSKSENAKYRQELAQYFSDVGNLTKFHTLIIIMSNLAYCGSITTAELYDDIFVILSVLRPFYKSQNDLNFHESLEIVTSDKCFHPMNLFILTTRFWTVTCPRGLFLNTIRLHRRFSVLKKHVI